MTNKPVRFAEVLAQRLTRRDVLQAGVSLAPLVIAGCSSSEAVSAAKRAGLSFTPIAGSDADEVRLAPGYAYDVIVRWGESLRSSVPDLDASKLRGGALFEAQAASHQALQFGQNCDAIQYFPINGRSDHGLLCVNNEFTDDAVMYPGHPGFYGARSGDTARYVYKNPQCVAVSQAAQGVSVIEIARERGVWRMRRDSRYARRITANTPIDIGGAARGATLMKTQADPQGIRALGTFGNCAGGQTPWSTYLTAEENVQDYFGHAALMQRKHRSDDPVIRAHQRWRMWDRHSLYCWELADYRFDLSQHPTEALRFGWIVEIDPFEPSRAPVKRTALGRFAHECATPFVAPNGRVAVYMGDDAKFEYVYKFVTAGRFDPKNPRANRDLLEQGTLYVARFNADGTGEWLPLVYDEQGPLNRGAGFQDQADVLIKARAAGDVLGATPMDRPEDVEANPLTGRIYIACTNNDGRSEESKHGLYRGREIDFGPNAANPRADNRYGHIIEIHEGADDHSGTRFTWEVFLLAGDPRGGKLVTDLTQVRADSSYFAGYANAAELSPIGSPDNLGFDSEGNLWIVTDGPQPNGANNGCWVCPTAGEHRGRLQQFMSGPIGAEVCGCVFTPDGETLFLSIQHPGAGGTLLEPSSHWPDGGDSPPRASVIAVRKLAGGRIGS